MNHGIHSPIISLKAHNLTLKKKGMHAVDSRPFCSLSYRMQGVVKFHCNKNNIIAQPGSILFMPSGQAYKTEIAEDTEFIVIHFETFHSPSSSPFVIDNPNVIMQQLFEQVLKNYSPSDKNQYECYSYFYKILAEIEKHLQQKAHSQINPAVLKAKLLIDKNLSDRNFNIDSLLPHLDISASHLRNEFKKNYTFTPIEYLQHVRLQHALSLLSTQYYSINEIAEKSGYSSTSYFIQVFQHHFGCSPRKYREKFMYK